VGAPAWAQSGSGANAPTQEQQADGCPADCPMHAAGEACDCPGHAGGGHAGKACPMNEAKQAGVTARVEETDRGAVIRLEGPQGNTQARDQARKVARHVAQMAEKGCPHMGNLPKSSDTAAAPGQQQSR
jgi:hypothetical protein